MKATTVTVSGTKLETAVRLCTAATADPAKRHATLEINRLGVNVRHRIDQPGEAPVTVSVETLPLLYRTVQPPEVPEVTIVLDYRQVAGFLQAARGDRVRITHRPPAVRGRRGTVNLENIERRQDLTSDIPDCAPEPAPVRKTRIEIARISRQTLIGRLKALAALIDPAGGIVTVTVKGASKATASRPRLVLGARTPRAEMAMAIEPGPGSPPLPTDNETRSLEIPRTAVAALNEILAQAGTIVTNQIGFKTHGNITASLPSEDAEWLRDPAVYIDWNAGREQVEAPTGHRDQDADCVMESGAESLLRSLETIASEPQPSDADGECIVRLQPHLRRLTNANERCRHRIDVVVPPEPGATEFTADARDLAGIVNTLKANKDWGARSASTAMATIKLYRNDGDSAEVAIVGPDGGAGRARARLAERRRD